MNDDDALNEMLEAHPPDEIFDRFLKFHAGPNPYYRCKKCDGLEPGIREFLENHLCKKAGS